MNNIHTAYPDRYELLRVFARQNRNNPTLAEQCLWQILRRKTLGVEFRRQHIIGDYIADFICLEKKLIIEVDGGYHSLPDQVEDDETRSRNLEALGYQVIRFSNEEVLNDTANVVERIKKPLTPVPLEPLTPVPFPLKGQGE